MLPISSEKVLLDFLSSILQDEHLSLLFGPELDLDPWHLISRFFFYFPITLLITVAQKFAE